MNILISGSSGLVGSALVTSLFTKGCTVQALQRNTGEDSHRPYWDTSPLAGRDNFDAIVNLAGENVAEGRWTAEKKEAILNSRIDSTRALVDYIAGLAQKPEVFLCASAAGYYGDRGDEVLDETSGLGSSFLADVCDRWERESARVLQMGVRLVNLRFGMILSPRGGALMKMLPAFKKKMGGTLGNGSQYMSWVSIRDVVEIIDFAIRSCPRHHNVFKGTTLYDEDGLRADG